MKGLRSLLDRKRYDALRRRLVARVLRSIYRPIESTIRRDGELAGKNIRRILVCRPNHRLGNTLLLTPLIQELERRFPEATIDLVVGGDAGPDVFKTFRTVANVYCLPRHMAKHPLCVVGLARTLRKARYDLAIDPCDGSQSGRLLLAIASAGHAVGVASLDSGHGHGPPEAMPGAPTHMGQLPVFLLRNALSQAGANGGAAYPALSIELTGIERAAARVVLDSLVVDRIEDRPKAVLGIFAAATGRKRYDVEWWRRFLAAFRSHCADTAVVELATERGQSSFSSALPAYSSTSVRDVASFISSVTCFVCADCGVMHLASASGTTTVGLFSTTDPAKYAPYGNGSRAIRTDGKSPEEVASIVASVLKARDREPATIDTR